MIRWSSLTQSGKSGAAEMMSLLLVGEPIEILSSVNAYWKLKLRPACMSASGSSER